MLKQTLNQIGQSIQSFFQNGVEAVAKRTGFVQRASKLTGMKFLQAMVFSTLEEPEMSLSTLRQSCLDAGVSISEQGLDERLNASSVCFLREMFQQAMSQFRTQEGVGIAILQQFAKVYLVDSTQIALPATMSKLFPGALGDECAGSLKVQLVFEYLNGYFAKLEESNGRQPDQGYRGHWSLIEKNALFLFDLGYFVLETFKTIANQGAFFLSRFQPQTALLTLEGERIDLKQLLAQQTTPLAEYEVCIGSRAQHRIPTRLILIRLPQEVADRNRQKARNNARRHGRTPSQDYLKLLDWAFFITNLPPQRLHPEHVAQLYRIRWQIELVFKLAKSFAGLSTITSRRPERVLSEFYAKLIGLLLTYFLIAPFRILSPSSASSFSEISPTKARRIFRRFARFFSLSLHHLDLFLAQLQTFFDHLSLLASKQKRRKFPNALFALALISACYDWNLADLSSHSLDFLSPLEELSLCQSIKLSHYTQA